MSPSDIEDRELCPDGSCIGVIGADGKCKVCGTPGPTAAPFRTAAVQTEAPPAESESDSQAPEPPEEPLDPDPDPDWDARRLCPDDSCIGVLSPSGTCNLCGKPGPGTPGTLPGDPTT